MATSKTKAIERKRISEALLADRLGLNEDWIERWEERGEHREELLAPDRLPGFIGKKYEKGQIRRDESEVKGVESEVERLVAAGCQRRVVYFCLAQLSPEATRFRAGFERESVFGYAQKGAVMDAAYLGDYKKRELATHEDLEAVVNTAKAARRQIHRYQRELFLVAESSGHPLPIGFECRPKTAIEALELLRDSLTWVSSLAKAYTAPMETTLVKSKGLLYLTLYVLMFADSKKLLGSRPSDFHHDSSKPSDTVVARRTLHAGHPLTNLAARLTSTPNDNKDKGSEQKNRKVTSKRKDGKKLNDKNRKETAWSVSDLNRKLKDFQENHPQLYKRLAAKLKELHNFTAR